MHGAIARAAAERAVGAAGAGRRRGAAARRQRPTPRDRRSNTSAHRCRPTCAISLTQPGRPAMRRKLQELLDRARAARRAHQPRGAREGGARTGAGRAAAGRLHAGARQDRQRKPAARSGCASAARKSGPVYAGMSRLSGERMQQQHLRENENVERRTDRFLELEMFTAAPMTPNLSGLEVEYAVALIYSSEAGRREATITFDVGQGTQDLGFRAEVPVLFTVKPAIAVKLRVRDHDGTPTTGAVSVRRSRRATSSRRRRSGWRRICSSRSTSTARDGEDVLLPPGELTMFYGRGPEYRWIKRTVTIPRRIRSATARLASAELAVKLERWIDPAGARLLQRRPSHPRGRLRALHVADRGRRSGGHVPAGQGRGAQRRQRADVGSGLRSSAAVLRAGGRQAQRAADADEVRHRGQRLRLGGARPRRACSI